MTVADLRALLAKLPDDAPVLVPNGEEDHELGEPYVVLEATDVDGVLYEGVDADEGERVPALVLF